MMEVERVRGEKSGTKCTTPLHASHRPPAPFLAQTISNLAKGDSGLHHLGLKGRRVRVRVRSLILTLTHSLSSFPLSLSSPVSCIPPPTPHCHTLSNCLNLQPRPLLQPMPDPAQDTDASVSTFVSSAVFTSVVSAALFLAFGIVRLRFPRVYAPRSYLGPEQDRPRHSIQGFLGWVVGSRHYSEPELIELCGLDAYMFLEFLNKSFYLFLGFSFLSLPILIPLNASNQLDLAGLNQLTMANIETQQRLWAHLVLTVSFAGKLM